MFSMQFIYIVTFYFYALRAAGTTNNDTKEDINIKLLNTRRILNGKEVFDTRPYMVYLTASPNSNPKLDGSWLCGGAIIHEQYILTSAACIEDAKHFYVISGTHRYVAGNQTDECIVNGAKKAVWKCVPKKYVFDGTSYNNIRWMLQDIAVVKVDSVFNFEKRVLGCDFIPNKINFNNISMDVVKPGTVASTAGWGSQSGFKIDIDNNTSLRINTDLEKSSNNSPVLLETNVIIISKKNCKKRWDERYHYIIDESMICSKDTMDDSMSEACKNKEVNCQEMVYSDEDEKVEEELTRRHMPNINALELHTSHHINLDFRRKHKITTGGFCENDHGGPLVVGYGKSATVVGVISACLTKNVTKKCYGPYLYTNVWNHRGLINCAIDKEKSATCRRLLKTTKTVFDWSSSSKEPSVSKIAKEDKKFQMRMRAVINSKEANPPANVSDSESSGMDLA